MARAHNSGPALHLSREADYRAIEKFYRDRLEVTVPPSDLVYEPVRLGPVWDWNAERGWLLPEVTLGWGVLSWSTYWLTGKAGKPWIWTCEQSRVILWLYALAVEDAASLGVPDFLAHTYALQRLKGWGKDPTAAGLATCSLHAPVMFDHWEGDRPVGRDDPDAWTQVVAVSQEQTQNTMKLFPGLIPQETRDYYGIQIGKLNIWSDGDRRQIQAITSNPLSVEGGRPHFIVRAETQNWLSSNGGHEMVGAMEGNAAKSEETTPARILDIFNAHRPGRDSVAERARDAWESTQGDDPTHVDYGVMWDSLEAPQDAPLTKEAAPEVLRSVAGDATWLDRRPNGRIVKSILNPNNAPSESRRKWYNQTRGAEDAWVEPAWVDKCDVKRGKGLDRETKLQPGDRVVMFGDGSKSSDCTAILAVRLSDGFAETIHFQQPTDGKVVDRDAADEAVTLAFDTYKVVAFYFDPSHAKDDNATDDDRFWWPMVDSWHQRYHRRLAKEFWPVKTGPKAHSIAFDMSSSSSSNSRQALFQPAVTQLSEDLEAGIALHHGGGHLRRHMKAAQRREGQYGVVLGKESASRKIDLAVCFVGARMLWRIVRLAQKSGTPGRGRVLVME